MSINMVEVTWKGKLKQVRYPNPDPNPGAPHWGSGAHS